MEKKTGTNHYAYVIAVACCMCVFGGAGLVKCGTGAFGSGKTAGR